MQISEQPAVPSLSPSPFLSFSFLLACSSFLPTPFWYCGRTVCVASDLPPNPTVCPHSVCPVALRQFANNLLSFPLWNPFLLVISRPILFGF